MFLLLELNNYILLYHVNIIVCNWLSHELKKYLLTLNLHGDTCQNNFVTQTYNYTYAAYIFIALNFNTLLSSCYKSEIIRSTIKPSLKNN